MDSDEKVRQVDMAGLEIIHYPDPRLTEVSAPLAEVDGAVTALVDRMFELMFEGNGVGLAAPQVGLTVLLFITSPTFDPADRHVYINPQIIATEGTVESEEGCLSVPDFTADVERAAEITLEGTDLDGKPILEEAEGLRAVCFQHEIDHLDGVVFTDRLSITAKMDPQETI